jgi:hypothetical protein
MRGRLVVLGGVAIREAYHAEIVVGASVVGTSDPDLQ